jgi:drug/metabolite transporter (DMT)-like permease
MSRKQGGVNKMQTVVTVILLVVSIGLAVAGQIAMKAGMNDVTKMNPKTGIAAEPLQMSDFKHLGTLLKRVFSDGKWAVAGIILYAISALFWFVVLSRTSLSVAYPMVAAGYIVVVLYSKFVFDEPVKAIAWVGLAFIVIGVVITAQGLPSKKNTVTELKPATAVVQTVQPHSPEVNGGASLDE